MSFDEEIRDIRKKMIEVDLDILKSFTKTIECYSKKNKSKVIKAMTEIIERVENNFNRLWENT